MEKWVDSCLSRSIDLVRHPHRSSYSYVTNMNHPYYFLTITILCVSNDTREIGLGTIQDCILIDSDQVCSLAYSLSPIKPNLQSKRH